jgi:hypothetical protein
MLDAPLPPRAALLLGAIGLLPAAAATAGVLLAPRGWQLLALRFAAAYAAAILGFIGGAWWGIAATRAREIELTPLLVASTLPVAGAVAALLLRGAVAPIVLGLLFLPCLAMDRHLTRTRIAPEWWLSFRLPLSLCMAGLNVFLGVIELGRH